MVSAIKALTTWSCLSLFLQLTHRCQSFLLKCEAP